MTTRAVNPNRWPERWRLALEACVRLGGDVDELVIREPAAESAVTAVERELNLALPPSFRQVLTGFSSEVDFRWALPDEFPLPEPLRAIFSGECRWNLERLPAIEDTRKVWVAGCYPNIEDEYDRVWHNKLAFFEVANGDLLALDLAVDPSPVVYLSHDGGEGHGYLLGADFADFIDRWTLLACVGAEDWQMMPFLDSPTALLDPGGAMAGQWRAVFGVTFAE